MQTTAGAPEVHGDRRRADQIKRTVFVVGGERSGGRSIAGRNPRGSALRLSRQEATGAALTASSAVPTSGVDAVVEDDASSATKGERQQLR